MEELSHHQGLLAAAAGVLMIFCMFLGMVIAFVLVCHWKVYSKAGKPGWAAIVPIYNYIVMLEIVGKPTWWVALLFIPGVNIVIAVLVVIELAKSFGQSSGFTVGLLLLPIVFYPILAFGEARYIGPGGIAAAPATV